MKGIAALVLVIGLAGCQHLSPLDLAGAPANLWRSAHLNLAVGEFSAASAEFARLVEEHPQTREGREAIFYLGALRLDPRNPEWDPRPAAEWLRRYADMDTTRARVARGPEARILLGLADQLNLPAAERVEGLAPETRVVRERVVIPAEQSRELEAEVTRLRRQVAERDDRIRQQNAEIERMRRALAPRN